MKKKYLFVFAIFLTKICAGQLTISKTDTICFPVDTVKKILVAAERSKVLDRQIVILNLRITSKDNTIRLLQKKDSTSVAKYNQQLKLNEDEKKIYKDQLNGYEKLLKRQKRKTFLATAGGILTTGIMTFLFIRK